MCELTTMNRDRLATYWRLREILAPAIRYSQSEYEDALTELVKEATMWLDLGGGHAVLPAWRVDRERCLVNRAHTCVVADRDIESLGRHNTIVHRVAADATKLPFPDESFCLVTANMVIEHLEEPQSALREACRVLRPGGVFLLHTPNAWSYGTLVARLLPQRARRRLSGILHGRAPDDVYPAVYRANTIPAIRLAATTVGMNVVWIHPVLSDAICAIAFPIAVLELLWLRVLGLPRLAALRPYLIGLLQKPPPPDRVAS